jgi:indole-3-glycerol phosphate synthase
MAEAGVAALAFAEPGAPMAAAAQATRLPVLCLRPVSAKDDYLAARAYGADAVLIDASLDARTRDDLAKGARSTRMLALGVARDPASLKRAVDEGARAVVLRADDAAAVRALASVAPANVVSVGWPARAGEDDARGLRGVVDAAIVGVDVYGLTGFERFVSEMST